MDRRAIAREGRRAQALDALTFEREREDALSDQLAAIVLEHEGSRVDEEAFARMRPDDVTRVQEILGTDDGDGLEGDDETLDDADDDEGEIRRLQDEIERCRASQHSLESYLQALDGTS